MSTLTITIIQPDLRWEDKAANLRLLEEKVRGIAEPTELVILPEMFSTGFSMQPQALAEKMDGATIDWMKKVAAQKRIILTGSIIIEEGGNYFNRLIWMLPTGQYGYYDKRHRFAFAGENEQYTAGHRRLIASVKGWKINLQVCYDLRFPVWSRQASPLPPTPPDSPAAQPPDRPTAPASSDPSISRTEGSSGSTPSVAAPHPSDRPTAPSPPGLEYDVLIYVANWPERRSHAWKTLLQARAIENQSYVVGVNRVGNDGNNIYHSGDSLIVDPLGEVLYHAPKEEAVFTYTLQRDKLEEIRQRFPFWRDADHFSIHP